MAGLVIGIMLLTSAGFTLGSTGIEALFFARFGVEYLPYMYMVLGTLSFLTSLGITILLGRFQKEKLYIFIPLIIAALTVIAWLALFSTWNVIYPILWLGKEVINSLVSLVIWGIAGKVCDTRQSKRLFPLFNAGRILGSVLGGMSVGLLVNLIGTENLMLAWAFTLTLTFFMVRALLNINGKASTPKSSRRHAESSLIEDVQQGYQFVRKSTLMIWISITAILFSILYFSIALPFSQSAVAQYPNENDLAAFLGIFNGLITATAFLASIFIANRLYARIGIINAVLVLPIIYLIGFGSLALSNTFIVILIFRFAQMVWMSGIADSAYQAIFNPVPPAQRDQVRAFIGGVPEQAGTFIAGAILIIGEQAFSSSQLALIGLCAAIATTYIFWRAGRAYNLALVDALKKGRPTIFSEDDRVGVNADGTAIQMALDGMTSNDFVVRRISAHMLNKVNLPATLNALVTALDDEDMDVRLIALKGLVRQKNISALTKISALLSSPEALIRARAVDALQALAPKDETIRPLLHPLLADADSRVKIRAIVALLFINPKDSARDQLRSMSMLGDVEERILALYALAEVGDPQAESMFSAELNHTQAPIAIRCAAASALVACGTSAIAPLTANLSTENILLRENIAAALGKIGAACLPAILDCLDQPDFENGALAALDQLPAQNESSRVKKYIALRIQSALRYEDMRLAIYKNEDSRVQLLSDALEYFARRDALNALRGFALLNDKNAVKVAIENLSSSNPSQKSNALETLETVKDSALIRPILRVFESNNAPSEINEQAAHSLLEKENNEWLKQYAQFAFSPSQKDTPMETTNTLSAMERVLHLHRVPLLNGLPPQDIQRVADVANEQDFTDGEVICEQGEAGDEMYVIISGEVRIMVQNENEAPKEIARRKVGDVVGEMSIISGDARIATMIASGDTRALCLDRLSFEGLLRERPEVSLAVMRELCNRLKQISK